MVVTLKEIAKMAGVSTTTVSRVINNKAIGNMSNETYERIKKIIEITGYTPNRLATALRSGLSKVIGVILPDNTNLYYAQLGNYIENQAYENDYLIIICNSNSDIERERKYINILTKYNVSGILLCSTGLTSEEIEKVSQSSVKIVLLDEEVTNFQGHIVIGDDFLGGYKGAEYLYKLGHRKILVILGPSQLNSTKNRLSGFLTFFYEKKIEYDRNLLIEGDFTINSSYRGIKKSIMNKLSFSAIFSFNDLMAIGALQALSEHSFVVPDDISILGYDNIFLDQYISPKITTVATPLEELAETAVKKIVKSKCWEDIKEKRVLIKPTLIERESCTRKTS